MADPLDDLIAKHVAPVAKRAGVARKGRLLRLRGDGAHVLLHFDRHGTPARTVFEVGYGVVPLAYWDFVSSLYPGGAPGKEPGLAGLFVGAFLMPPDEWSHRPDEMPPFVFRRRWEFGNETESDACGAALTSRLDEEAFPRMRYLLSLENVLAEVRSRTFTTPRALSSDEHREAVLTVDAADPRELHRLLDQGGPSPSARFDAWMRDRISRRER